MKQLIKNGRVIDPENNFDDIADILIEDGKIAQIGKDLMIQDAQVIDATGKVVAPGLIDMHVHFRLLPLFKETNRAIQCGIQT